MTAIPYDGGYILLISFACQGKHLLKVGYFDSLGVRYVIMLFDSEHFIYRHLVRVNNWEVYPILELEFCETGNNCTANSNAGWKALDDLRSEN